MQQGFGNFGAFRFHHVEMIFKSMIYRKEIDIATRQLRL